MNITHQKELDEVILDNRNLIYGIAKKYDYNIRDDLFQVGVIGMIDAYNNYDENYNTKFSTYAYPYIVGEMKKFIRENRDIKVSRDIIYLCSQIERTKDILCQKLKREPTLSELSQFLDIDEKHITEALLLNNSIRSLDEPINDEGRELTIQDVISKEENCDKLDLISLRDELSKLTPLEKGILQKRYYEGRTQCETASMMGITQVDVSRTERKLILTLKSKLQ
jgi:RNA polymerase sporulation-specific sigma factor